MSLKVRITSDVAKACIKELNSYDVPLMKLK